MSAPAETSYNKDNPFPAVVRENRLLNKPGSAKEVRHYAIDISGSGLTYKVGDSLGVFATNRSEDVEEILQLLGCSGDEPVSVPRVEGTLPLRDALFSRVALSSPTRKLVELMAAKTEDVSEKERLSALVAPEAKEQLSAFLEQREFIDLLHEFPGVRWTAQEFAGNLRRLMPRLYSIASSPRLYPTEIHLTVATVRYTSNDRSRVGVCSSFLADRAFLNETVVPVFVSDSHFGVPADPARDIIMVGPGTGIAPFRAFVQERVATRSTGRNWLFFGDQHRSTDYLYEEEWDRYLAEGQLHHLDLAFSRDQAAKIYVQDRMLEQAAELWKWIESGAYFYVCGDAKRMAKDVDAALHQIIAQEGKMEPAQAADYIKLMKKEKRYQRDVY